MEDASMKSFDTTFITINYRSPDLRINVEKEVRIFLAEIPRNLVFHFRDKSPDRPFIEVSGFPLDEDAVRMIMWLVVDAIRKAHEDRFPLLRKARLCMPYETGEQMGMFLLNDYRGYQSIKRNLKQIIRRRARKHNFNYGRLYPQR